MSISALNTPFSPSSHLQNHNHFLTPEQKHTLENFDDLIVGDPFHIETTLTALLPNALLLENQSIHVQILTQIALAQAMQNKFSQAHDTIDFAASLASDQDFIGRARVIVERGRIFWLWGNLEAALSLFYESFELSQKELLIDHACNAAHLIALVTPNVEDKIYWNQQAIDFAKCSSTLRISASCGTLHHNLGGAYLEAKEFQKALETFQKTLEFRQQEGVEPHIHIAKWHIAYVLRCLGEYDEALAKIIELQEEYSDFLEKQAIPRGLVRGELAEICAAKQDPQAKKMAELALEDLKDSPIAPFEGERIQRLELLADDIPRTCGIEI